jgi:hypothetical protein
MDGAEREPLVEQMPLSVEIREAVRVVEQAGYGLDMVIGAPF